MLHQGSCHCGRIAFEVEADFTQAVDCNCSLCRRRGSLLAFTPRNRLKLKTPVEALSTYRFNRHVIDHHFCSTCGVAPFAEADTQGGDKGAMVNLRCLPDFDLSGVEIVKYDGASH